MKTITMTEFNQHVSAVTREVVEHGETIRVTNRGKVVLRLVPEAEHQLDPLDSLIAAGLATAPKREHRPIRRRNPVPLSRPLDELLDETNRDPDV